MTIHRWLRPLTLWLLARKRDLTQKQIAARTGLPEHSVWYRLARKDLDDQEFEALLPAFEARRAHAAVAAVLLEALDGLDHEDGLMPEERDELEMAALGLWQKIREILYELVHLSRACPPLDEYPKPEDVEPIRWLAGAQLAILKQLTHEERLAVVGSVRKYQHWGLMEVVAHESTHACSRNLDEATGWAQLAVEVAERVRGPEGWRTAVRGYAAGFGPNVLRVRGEHDEASTGLEQATRLWQAGSDPDQVLDPGRLFDLEASLRRAQRRFPEAVASLDRALEVTHCRARVLVNKAFTQEVMGDYEGAAETHREAEPLVLQEGDPRLLYMQRFNRAVLSTHLGRNAEADALLQEVRGLVIERADEIELYRVTWLQGRIYAGLGRHEKARTLLELARWQFASKQMWFDVALALLELAALLLNQGRLAEVKALTPKLVEVFKSKKVHPEALAALRLFREAVEEDAANEELARRVLRFLFRARHDQGLRFDS
jgi:tetratricopeptide (TPR) repeat protein